MIRLRPTCSHLFAAPRALAIVMLFASFAAPAGAQATGRAATPTPASVPAPAQSRPAAPAPVRPPAIGRVDLQRHDLSTPGRETIQTRVDFPPGAIAPRHRHPGEELVFVLRGTLEYRLDGQAPVTLNPGDVLFIPAGAVHAVRNVGSVPGSELATYIVDKSQPLITLVP